ncbi:MAG: hypothetical protein PVH29_12920 [Candidatus Zixiibacteriota bacterium]|jgi:hypothetical protein
MSDLTGAYGILFFGTAAALLAAMVALEVYRLRTGRPGRFVRFKADAGAFGLAPRTAEVELDAGELIEATVPGCTQCVCRFQPGDAVVVTRTSGRYYVGAALVRRRSSRPDCAAKSAPGQS